MPIFSMCSGLIQVEISVVYSFLYTILSGARVVTYMSPVEVFVSGIKIFDHQKVCLIA